MGTKRKDSNAVEAMIHSNSLPKKMKSKVTDIAVRRSSRLNSSIFPKLNKPALEHLNHVETENNGRVNTEKTGFQHSNGLPPKKTNSKDTNAVIRRSNRLKNSVSGNHRIKKKDLPVQNKRNVEKEAPNIEQINTVSFLNEGNVNREDVEGIVRSADEVKSKAFNQVSRRTNEGSSADLSYKSLYIDSQKAIEALMEKHYEVIKKLEYANGKIDAYEEMNMMLVLMWQKDATDDDQNASSEKKKKAKSGKC